MRLNILILMAVISATFGVTYVWDFMREPAREYQAYSPAPAIAFDTVGGEKIPLSSFKGKTVLINVWATWCPPCVIEFPQMIELAATSDDIILIALSVDEDEKKLDAFIKKQDKAHIEHQNVIIAKDPEKKLSKDILKITQYPETIVVSPDGLMGDHIIGAVDWRSDAIRKRLEIAAGKSR